MADYVEILDTQIEPDAPLTAVLAGQWRDNCIAIAEGAAGAPRVRTLAMQPPSAGDNHIIMRLQEADRFTDNSDYPVTGLNNRASSTQHLGFTALVAGVIRCYLQHRVTSSFGGHSSNVRILKNRSTVQSWSTTSDSYQTRTVDVSVDVGDVVIFQNRVSDSAAQTRWRRLRVYSATPDMAVA